MMKLKQMRLIDIQREAEKMTPGQLRNLCEASIAIQATLPDYRMSEMHHIETVCKTALAGMGKA